MQTESEKNKSMKNKIVLGIMGVLFIVAYFTTAQDNIVNIDPIEDYFVEVARGNVQGTGFIHKFGSNFDVGNSMEDIWEQGGLYNWQDTATVYNVTSTSNSDVWGGTGAWDVTLTGLDANYNEYSETVRMNGQTGNTTTGQFIRVFRAIVGFSGANDYNVGDIYVSTGSSTAGVPVDTTQIYAKMEADHGQTLMAIYTVPSGKTAYILEGHFTSDGSKPIYAHYWNRPFNKSTNVKFDFDFTDQYAFHYDVPKPIEEKTDVWMSAEASTGSAKISGGFDLLLIET